MKKMFYRICLISPMNKLFILLVLVFYSCSFHEDISLFNKNEEISTYDVYKRTKFFPEIRRTYIFKRNGEFYSFEYYINDNKKNRRTDNDAFFHPEKWEINKDSILLNKVKYKIHFAKNLITLSKSNSDTIWLKKQSNDFGIEFFKKSKYYYLLNKNGDTMEKIEKTYK